jgi:hypothetical protein
VDEYEEYEGREDDAADGDRNASDPLALNLALPLALALELSLLVLSAARVASLVSFRRRTTWTGHVVLPTSLVS